MGRRERNEAKKRVSRSRDPTLQWSYRLWTDGSRRTIVPRCGSRRRKLVEGNRFITREREKRENRTRRAAWTEESGDGERFRARDTNNSSCPPLSFCFLYLLYTYTHASYVFALFVPSCLASSSLRRGLLFRHVRSTWTRREVETYPRTFLRFSSIPRQIVPNWITVSLSLFFSLPFSPCISSTSCLLYRNFMRSRSRVLRKSVFDSRDKQSIQMT